jgi:hypothetical protein
MMILRRRNLVGVPSAYGALFVDLGFTLVNDGAFGKDDPLVVPETEQVI